MSDLKIYTKKEVAEILKVTLNTVNRWIKDGTLKSKKFAGTVRVLEKDLLEFIGEKEGK